jgi:hypothetical protein
MLDALIVLLTTQQKNFHGYTAPKIVMTVGKAISKLKNGKRKKTMIELLGFLRLQAQALVNTPQKVEVLLDRGVLKLEPLYLMMGKPSDIFNKLTAYLSDSEITKMNKNIDAFKEQLKTLDLSLIKNIESIDSAQVDLVNSVLNLRTVDEQS